MSMTSSIDSFPSLCKCLVSIYGRVGIKTSLTLLEHIGFKVDPAEWTDYFKANLGKDLGGFTILEENGVLFLNDPTLSSEALEDMKRDGYYYLPDKATFLKYLDPYFRENERGFANILSFLKPYFKGVKGNYEEEVLRFIKGSFRNLDTACSADEIIYGRKFGNKPIKGNKMDEFLLLYYAVFNDTKGPARRGFSPMEVGFLLMKEPK